MKKFFLTLSIVISGFVIYYGNLYKTSVDYVNQKELQNWSKEAVMRFSLTLEFKETKDIEGLSLNTRLGDPLAASVLVHLLPLNDWHKLVEDGLGNCQFYDCSELYKVYVKNVKSPKIKRLPEWNESSKHLERALLVKQFFTNETAL